ncbi:MAG: hypothetical protein DRN99_04355 [Thermoproteota archaeon]|nr:MAG: hypothetical protein DRN99_04355 [Candidatus Korarchaeota archaeon]
MLKRIENGEEALTNTAVIQEVIDWLEYNNRVREVEAVVTAINSYVSMEKAEVTWSDMLAALDDMKRYGLSFVDALILQTMRKYGVVELYSNDKDFDRVEWVRKVWS